MDKSQRAYRSSSGIYDDFMTARKWWSKALLRILWGKANATETASELLNLIPDDFAGSLLDVPAGTLVFTTGKYHSLKKSSIVGFDYSRDMLAVAEKRAAEYHLGNLRLIQGDVGALPFTDESFDYVVCLNGLHVFPDKAKAYSEIHRVLRKGGRLLACNYVHGERRISDLAASLYVRKGWFAPHCETASQIRQRLEDLYSLKTFKISGSMLSFCAKKER